MKLLVLLLNLCLTALAANPPCPSTPANYCQCGSGVNAKFLCRANNGYTWETNDKAPVDPCPAKYPKCTILTTAELLAHAVPASESICDPTGFVHTIGTEGNIKGKCVEVSFGGGKLQSQFWQAQGWKYSPPVGKSWLEGACDLDKFPTKESEQDDYLGWSDAKNDPGCGGVNVKTFAPSAALTMALTAVSKDCRADKSATPVQIAFKNTAAVRTKIRGCLNQYACKPYRDCELALAPGASETVTIDASFKYMVFTFYGEGKETELYPDANMKYPSTYDIKDSAVTMMLQTEMVVASAPAPPPVVKHLEDGKDGHCTDLTVNFSMDSDLDRVKDWWGANEYKYASWANSTCPTKYNSPDRPVQHPIGVNGVSIQEKGITSVFLSTAAAVTCNSADSIKACDAMKGCIWSHFGCVANHGIVPLVEVMAEEPTFFHAMQGTTCLEATWMMDGVKTPGMCPEVFDIRQKHEADTVCRTGGNLRYCKPADVMNVTLTTWGQTGWSHAIQANHCVEANFTIPGVIQPGKCPTGQYSKVQTDQITTVCRNGDNLKYCTPRDVVVVEVVTRGD